MKVMRQGYWLGTVDSYMKSEATSNERVAPATIRDIQSLKPAMFSGGEEDEREGIDVGYMLSTIGPVGVIKINGTLVNEYHPTNRYWGEVSYDEIAAAAAEMRQNESVKAVILDISSPGGDANGIERGSAALTELGREKPLYTFTSSMMCSGGYWLGCVGQQIWASSMSTVGSIGVVAIHRSFEKAFEKQGIDVTVMRQGKFKMILNPFEDLSPEAEKMMMDQMAIIYGMFLGHVSDHRGMSVQDLMAGAGQGQTFLGVQAVKEGLVDQIGDFNRLVNQLRSRYASQTTAGPAGLFKTQDDRGSVDMKTVTRDGKVFALNGRGQAAVAAGLSEDDALVNDEFLEEVKPGANEDPGDETPPGGEEGNPEGEPEGGAEPNANSSQPPAQAADMAAVLQLSEKLSTAGVEMGKLQAENASMKEKLETIQAGTSGLRRVAMSAVNRMEVAMGFQPSKVEDFDSDSTIVSKFNKLESDFNGRFKPGAKAEHSNGGNTAPGTAGGSENPAFDAPARNLTQL